MPAPAMAAVVPLGSSVSGQTAVQPLSSVQVILPPCSELSRYSVLPFPLTRTVRTPGTLAVVTVIAASALALGDPEEAVADGEDEVPVPAVVDFPQAASVRAAAMTLLHVCSSSPDKRTNQAACSTGGTRIEIATGYRHGHGVRRRPATGPEPRRPRRGRRAEPPPPPGGRPLRVALVGRVGGARRALPGGLRAGQAA